jgi:hypothetical protein
MIRTKAYDFDNRDSGQVYEYLEARIEAMKRRLAELEAENERLQFELFAVECSKGEHQYAASA